MTTGIPVTTSFFRGQTLQFQTTFFDFAGNVAQPPAAHLVVFYDAIAGEDQQIVIPMTPPTLPSVIWTALLDTRGFEAPRQVQWSIYSAGTAPQPVAVQDGTFTLTANQANQPSF